MSYHPDTHQITLVTWFSNVVYQRRQSIPSGLP